MMIEPAHPLLRCQFNEFSRFPGAAMNQFNLPQAVDRFSQGVVIAVAPVADRRFDARFGQALAVANADVLASFKISLARRSSFLSRSSTSSRARSDMLTPSRSPLSTSSRLTHPGSVWLVQPILGAMDSIAAHCDGYSPRCSRTMRTACPSS